MRFGERRNGFPRIFDRPNCVREKMIIVKTIKCRTDEPARGARPIRRFRIAPYDRLSPLWEQLVSGIDPGQSGESLDNRLYAVTISRLRKAKNFSFGLLPLGRLIRRIECGAARNGFR